MLLGGVADTLGEDLEIKIRKENSIKIPKYNGVLSLNMPFPFSSMAPGET